MIWGAYILTQHDMCSYLVADLGGGSFKLERSTRIMDQMEPPYLPK